MDLGLHLEAISGPFWSHAGPLRAKVATQTPKKEVWREVQNQDRKKVRFGPSREGVRRVHSCTIAQFSLFCPCPSGLHFCLHFEAIWGTKFATILFLGHPRRQQAAQLGTCFRGCFFRVLGGLTEFAIGVCVWLTEFAIGVCVCGGSHPQGRREGGEEEVLRRLLTPKGVGGFGGRGGPWAIVIIWGDNPEPP